jgi:hypothetical protein
MPFAELTEQPTAEEFYEQEAPEGWGVEEARAAASASARTFRVVGANARTGKERVVAEGLSREAAEAMRQRMRRDVLCHGFSVWIECEQKETR